MSFRPKPFINEFWAHYAAVLAVVPHRTSYGVHYFTTPRHRMPPSAQQSCTLCGRAPHTTTVRRHPAAASLHFQPYTKQGQQLHCDLQRSMVLCHVAGLQGLLLLPPTAALAQQLKARHCKLMGAAGAGARRGQARGSSWPQLQQRAAQVLVAAGQLEVGQR